MVTKFQALIRGWAQHETTGNYMSFPERLNECKSMEYNFDAWLERLDNSLTLSINFWEPTKKQITEL